MQQLTTISQSNSQLEHIVPSLARSIDGINHVDGSINEQLEDLHDILQKLTVSPTSIPKPPIPRKHPARSPILDGKKYRSEPLSPSSPLPTTSEQQNVPSSISTPLGSRRSSQYLQLSSPTISPEVPSSPKCESMASKASSPSQKRVSEFSFGVSSLRYSSSSYASSTTSSTEWSSHGAPRDPLVSRSPHMSQKIMSPLSRTLEVRQPGKRSSEDALLLLPPPALGYATPSGLERGTSHASLSPYPATQPNLIKLHRSSTTSSQRAAFEKEAFRNAAILCDV